MNQAGWKTSRFTSQESGLHRKKIMKSFKDGDIDALVSMKVLDEGIDVPDCHTAIITASTRNPRQFVQRRGRVLRRAEGKEKAVIYDFVVMPHASADARYAGALKSAELERVDDFLRSAQNKLEVENEVEKIGIRHDR